MSAFILSACRSAVAPRGGAFDALSLHALAAPVLRAALEQAGIAPAQVDEVIVSNALGGGGNPARVVALAAGLPEQVAGLSLDRQCAGGLDALLLARALIASGAAEIVVAGGAESYSRRPLRSATFADGRPPMPYQQPPFTPWPDRDPDMAQAAHDLGQTLGITRQAQDDWAVASHAKARAYPNRQAEIVAIAGTNHDPFTRKLTASICARAKPIVGDITMANAAVAADAAAFCVVVSERIAKQCAGPVVEILAGASKGAAPELPGLAPVTAINAALSQTELTPRDLALTEIMEAYAVQAIACVQGAGLDPNGVNPGGGALARGHPIGASGTINAVRLWHGLVQRGGGTGLAAIAAAGGIGTALVLRA